MAAVRLGLIGLGEWARQAYVPLLREMEDVQVAAVAARSEATRQFAREVFGDEVSLYDSWSALLKDQAVSAVIVALPNQLHSEATAAAIASGKHVFYELPAGLNEAEIDKVFAAQKHSSAVIQADLELRYLPVAVAAHRLITSGEIGDLLSAKVSLACNWGYQGGDWNQDVEAEGFFFWLGCWYLDLLDMMCAAAPVRAHVSGGRAMNGKVMDHGWALLEYANGVLGQFEFNLISSSDLAIAVHACGTEGELQADIEKGVCRWRRQGSSWCSCEHPCSQPVHGFAGMRESLTYFLECMSTGLSGQDRRIARRVHQAALMCHQRDQGQEV